MILCGLIGAATPSRSQVSLPSLGDSVTDDFSLSEERRLGEQIMREVRRDPAFLDDPVLLQYLQSLWLPLLDTSRKTGNIDADTQDRFAWEVFMLRERTVNAFALPGGYFGVHLGLIALTQTSDELASVLSHELAHATQRHIARGFATGKRQSLISLATLLLGALAASRSSNPDVANAVLTAGQAASIQGMLNFSRDMEREADRIGFSVMQGAGFTPNGMVQMFERLERSARLNDSASYPYLRTHPLTTERIGQAQSRLGFTGSAPASTSGPTTHTLHLLMQARARVLMDPRAQTLQNLQTVTTPDQKSSRTSTPSATEWLVAHYQNTLVSLKLRDWTRAAQSLKQAQQVLPEVLNVSQQTSQHSAEVEKTIHLLAAELAVAQNKPRQIEEAFQALALNTSRPALLLQAQAALLATGPLQKEQLLKSAEALQTWLSQNPKDTLAWSALGQVWPPLGQPLRALRAQAEASYTQGDLQGAIDRLRAAQTQTRRSVSSTASPVDTIEPSVIDNRLRAWQELQRQIERESR
jgi:beta-barrel assembly-enhancing protease